MYPVISETYYYAITVRHVKRFHNTITSVTCNNYFLQFLKVL